MEYNAYYTTRQPVIHRSNSISIPYSAGLHSPQNNRNSSTASQDSGYSSSMSTQTANGDSPSQSRSTPNWACSQDWDKYRQIITTLYRDEGLHLKKVQQIMLKEYDFSASERMYKTRISKWGLDKNLKAHDVMVIYRMNQTRAIMGKRSVFTVRGRPMDYSRVEQYIRRDPSIVNRINSNEDLAEIPADHARNAGISCRTPSPSPPASPNLRPTALGQGPAMAYSNYNGYAPSSQHQQEQHSQAILRHPHHDQQQHYSHRQSFPQSAVLPSQAPLALSVPQMPLPMTTSAMSGFAGIPATSGPSPYSASMYGPPMSVNSSPTISPYNTIVTSGAPNNSAYQLSGPTHFSNGSTSHTPSLAPSTPASSMAMMPTTVSTPRTVNTEPRGYSFAPMPGYPEQGHPGQSHIMHSHDQYAADRVQHHSQHHQAQHHQAHHPASDSRANASSGHPAAGPSGSSSLPDGYSWNMDPNASWDSQFR